MAKQTVLERINMLQRQVIIHSILYYEFDDNIWTDERYDEACKELASLVSKKEFKKSDFYLQFKTFDGSTGYHLVKIFKATQADKALRLLEYHKKITKSTLNSY
jgi:NAD-dependent DNA ligase